MGKQKDICNKIAFSLLVHLLFACRIMFYGFFLMLQNASDITVKADVILL